MRLYCRAVGNCIKSPCRRAHCILKTPSYSFLFLICLGFVSSQMLFAFSSFLCPDFMFQFPSYSDFSLWSIIIITNDNSNIITIIAIVITTCGLLVHQCPEVFFYFFIKVIYLLCGIALRLGKWKISC